MRVFVPISIILFSFSPAFSQIEGEWHSAFLVMGDPQRLDITVESNVEYSVELSFPDFVGTENITATDVNFMNDTLCFSVNKLNAKYIGVYFEDADSISGVLSQSGMDFDIQFSRGFQEKIIINRPQEPVGERNYRVEYKKYKSKFSDVTLDVQITSPYDIDGRTPVVIMASGSGPQDKDEKMVGHKPFLVIADYLTKEGNIVVRFDDRGTGKSDGNFATATLQDFSTDVLSMIDMVKRTDGLKNNPIGIAGHSEGGMHSLLATKKSKNIDFLIFLACVGTTGREVLIEQQYLISKKAGETEETSRWIERIFLDVTNYISKYENIEAQDSLNAYLTKAHVNAPFDTELSLMQFIFTFSSFNSEYGRQFIDFEAEKYLRKFKGPIYAVNNGEDVQVPPFSNSEGFENSLSKKSRQANSRIYVEPGINHLFQTCSKCTVMEYGDLEETFSVKVLEDLSKWIESQYRK